MRVPLALAMSAELRGPNSYKAMDVVGVLARTVAELATRFPKGLAYSVPYDTTRDAYGNNIYAGPLARSVTDAAIMHSVLVGPSDKDPWTLSGNAQKPLSPKLAGSDLAGVRIGYIERTANPRVAADVRVAETVRVGVRVAHAHGRARTATRQLFNADGAATLRARRTPLRAAAVPVPAGRGAAGARPSAASSVSPPRGRRHAIR